MNVEVKALQVIPTGDVRLVLEIPHSDSDQALSLKDAIGLVIAAQFFRVINID